MVFESSLPQFLFPDLLLWRCYGTAGAVVAGGATSAGVVVAAGTVAAAGITTGGGAITGVCEGGMVDSIGAATGVDFQGNGLR